MLNTITIMGRMTKDPELRHTKTGTPVTTFSLAVDRDYKAADGSRETDFIECVAWKGTAEYVAKYFGQGRQAVVNGRLQVRTWTDKDGNKRKTYEVLAGNVYFADSKREETSGNYGNYASTANVEYEEIEDDDGDLPF